MPLTGQCLCGESRYTLDLPDLPAAYACHCRSCQTMSGAAGAIQAMVPIDRLHMEGELTEWIEVDHQGVATRQYFCRRCMTRLYSSNDVRPHAALLHAGTLDESERIAPVVHIWVKRKQPWLTLPADVECHQEGMTLERFLAIAAPNFA